MIVPRAEDIIREAFGIRSHDYNEGYEDGYRVAKEEIMAFIKTMQAFYTTSTTSVPSSDRRG
jgi:hypothetical protein